LIDFNSFGKVVSRRAGIIRSIDGEVIGVHSTPYDYEKEAGLAGRVRGGFF